jgi:hypothetical protein
MRDTQQVCLQGHQVTDVFSSAPETRKPHCPNCGSQTITECPVCGSSIPGAFLGDPLLGGYETVEVPKHCPTCGTPFPWTSASKKLRRSRAEPPPPQEVITLKWLWAYVPWRFWISLLLLIAAAFGAGFKAHALFLELTNKAILDKTQLPFLQSCRSVPSTSLDSDVDATILPKGKEIKE